MLFFQKPAHVYLKEQQKRRKLNREIYSIVPDQFRHPAGPSPTLSSVNSAQRPSCDRPVQARRQEKSHKTPGATWNIVLEGGWCRGSIGRAVELNHWSKIDLICAYVTCSLGSNMLLHIYVWARCINLQDEPVLLTLTTLCQTGLVIACIKSWQKLPFRVIKGNRQPYSNLPHVNNVRSAYVL